MILPMLTVAYTRPRRTVDEQREQVTVPQRGIFSAAVVVSGRGGVEARRRSPAIVGSCLRRWRQLRRQRCGGDGGDPRPPSLPSPPVEGSWCPGGHRHRRLRQRKGLPAS